MNHRRNPNRNDSKYRTLFFRSRLSRTLVLEPLELRNLMSGDTVAGTGLTAQYFNNEDLTDLALVRTDANIAFNWGAGSPDAVIGPDTFSARWSGQIEAIYTERYSFFANADNGVRLWVNGQMLIDRWTGSAVVDAKGTIDLVAGRKYDVLFEYFETTGTATVQLDWSSASQARQTVPTVRLFPSERGSISREVWNNVAGTSISSLTGLATYPNSPSVASQSNSFQGTNNQSDNFGERLRGLIHPPSTGDYTFYLAGDETAELWISNSNDSQYKQRISNVPSPTLANEWTKFPEQGSSAIKLVAGQSYYIEVLHKEATGADHVSVGWLVPNSSAIELIRGEFLSPILAEVALFAERPTTAEGTSDAARMRVVRSGLPINNPLSVSYALRGTAINGTDFASLSGNVVIPAGQDSAVIEFLPLNDILVEGTEFSIIELVDDPGYQLGGISQRTATATIQDNSPTPAGGTSLFTSTAFGDFDKFISLPGAGSFSSSADPVLGPVIQASITVVPANAFNAQLVKAINTPVKSDDILFAEFYVRSVSASANITAVFELNEGLYTKSLFQSLSVGTTWTKVQIPFLAKGDYAAAGSTQPGATFGFYLGSQIQTIQFARFNIRNYGPSSILATTDNLFLVNNGGTFGTMQNISVTGQSFSNAQSITTNATPPEVFKFQAVAKNSVATQAGDTVRVEYWARGADGSNPRLGVVLQEAFPPSYSTLEPTSPSIMSNWQRFTFSFTTARAYAAGELQVSFNAGFAPQTIEVGGFQLKNLTRGFEFSSLPTQFPNGSYGGRTGTDAWRTDADNRISQSRMAELTVQVQDATGKPVDGAVISIRQKNHAFKFGSAVSGDLLSANNSASALKYQSEIKRLFNTAVLENNLKWPDFSSSLANRQLGIDSANWIVGNGLALRGHNIIWPSMDRDKNYIPASVLDQFKNIKMTQGDTAAATYLRNTINARIIDAANTLNGKAFEWDIVNEPFANHDVMDVLGNNELLEWFRLFRLNDPNAKRTLNEYDIFARNGANAGARANFNNWLALLKSQNLIETIGEQSHYNESNLTDMTVLSQLIQTYTTSFGLPIAITEFDVDSSNAQLQADYLRDYMTMSFSQPGISEFVNWGFWSKQHYRPSLALYNDDFSIRPNGQAYEDLVFGEWWSDTRGTTRSGSFKSRITKGDYEIIVTLGTQSVTMPLNSFSADRSLTMTLPGFQVIVPLYQYPLASQVVLNPWWQQVLSGATAATPLTVIANPLNGPMLPTNSLYPDWIAGLSLLRTNPNIRIIGYVSTRISPSSPVVRPLSEIQASVNLYATAYKHASTGASLIDGIFLDEMSNNVSNAASYSAAASHIRSVNGLAGRFIVGNPGTSMPVEYLDQRTADVFLVREGRPADLLNNPAQPEVASPAYSQLGFGAVVYEAFGIGTLAQMLREMKLRKYDYAFVTDDIDNPNTTADSPYDVAPTYFSELLRDVHAPYIAAASFSLPENSANGTVVGTSVSGDPDVGQSLTYAILSGNTNNAFAIDPSTGRLSVNNSAAVDFETTPSFNVVVRATDNGSPLLSDSVTVAVALTDVSSSIANRYVYYRDSFFATTVDTGKVLLQSTNTAQTTGFANVSSYVRGINSLAVDINELTSPSLALSDFIFRVAPPGTSGTVNPSLWPLATPPSQIFYTLGTNAIPAKVQLEWPNNAVQNTWLQVIVKANAITKLLNPAVFYFGSAIGDTNGATGDGAAYRVGIPDLSAVQAAVSSAPVAIDNPLDIDKSGRVGIPDLSFVQSHVASTVLLNNITIPVAGSAEEGSAGSGAISSAISPMMSVVLSQVPSPFVVVSETDLRPSNGMSLQDAVIARANEINLELNGTTEAFRTSRTNESHSTVSLVRRGLRKSDITNEQIDDVFAKLTIQSLFPIN